MKVSEALTKYQFPEDVKNVILSSGIEMFYPPQAEAIDKGLLEGKSLLLSVPTAAGKTFMAELCMLRSIVLKGGRCLYIAPLKALAREKFVDFEKKYSSLGIKVGIAVGDLDTPSKHLSKYQIVIATAEKVDSLLRSKATWLINSLNVVVLDEIHFINDGSRGPTLEILTARIRQLNPNVQILGLSATISNAQQMADWLNAELVSSTWRPIPLKEGVYYDEKITFQKHGIRTVKEKPADDIGKLCLDTLKGRGQVLIFVNSRRSAQAVSRDVSSVVSSILTLDEKKELAEIAKKILGSPSDTTKMCRSLADTITRGAAFHHAGLKPVQRELIEDNFKKNIIKVISSTPTLAAGVNLPARRAIIRDCKRFESGIGAAFIPVSEYKQCAGRAGRPQYDEYGEAVLVAKSLSETKTLMERYINADPEPVLSKLASESALRIHILSSIAGGYVHDTNSMFEFLKHTFLYHQRRGVHLLEMIANIFEFLHNEKLIEKSGYRYFATPMGALTSRLYLDPLTTITLRDGLNALIKLKKHSTVGMLHMLVCSPDNPTLNVGKNDIDDIERFAAHFKNDFIFTPENHDALEDLFPYLATLKTTWMLSEWCEERKEDQICEQFGIGPGDVYRHVESTQWLLHAASLIAQLLMHKELTFSVDKLRQRLRYGIKEELLDLVQLRGIGRIRARQLFDKGFKNLDSIRHSSVEELVDVVKLGKSIAQDIIKQVHEAPKKKVVISAANSEDEQWEE